MVMLSYGLRRSRSVPKEGIDDRNRVFQRVPCRSDVGLQFVKKSFSPLAITHPVEGLCEGECVSFTSGMCAQENIDEQRGCFGSKKWSTEAQPGCAVEFITV